MEQKEKRDILDQWFSTFFSCFIVINLIVNLCNNIYLFLMSKEAKFTLSL